MLYYAIVYLAVALIAAVFGYSDLTPAVSGIARTLFVVFSLIAVVSYVVHLASRR